MNVKKILKLLPQELSAEMEGMDETALRNVIVESSNNIKTSKEEMEENTDFQSAKEGYKLAAEPFRDAVKFQDAKRSYALLLLESKGKL